MQRKVREFVRNFERKLSLPKNPLAAHGKRVYSQGLQDGMIEFIMQRLQIHVGESIEIGAWDGVRFSNTRNLLLNGWQCGYVEANPEKYAELVDNLQGYNGFSLNDAVSLKKGNTLDELIENLGLPVDLTLLCLDIDSNEFWVWKSLKRHKPKVVCIEYNAYCKPGECVSIAYDENQTWAGGFYYGASAFALCEIAKKHGYSLVGFEPGLDLFFVRNDLLAGTDLPKLYASDVPASLRINPFRGRIGRGTQDMIDVKGSLDDE